MADKLRDAGSDPNPHGYPAPPQDETGHTWHHDDAMLTDYITGGGQAVLDDMNVAFTPGMPGFGPVLDASEIRAILDYIKSTWPERIRETQAQRSQGMAIDWQMGSMFKPYGTGRIGTTGLQPRAYADRD